jgi:hypothetical protein
MSQSERLIALLPPIDYTCSSKGMCTHMHVRTYMMMKKCGSADMRVSH